MIARRAARPGGSALALLPAMLGCAFVASAGGPAPAQELQPCDARSAAPGLSDFGRDDVRTFGDGNILVARLDTGRPAFAPMRLLILSPPRDAEGRRQCRLVRLEDGLGFGQLYLSRAGARYDPGRGLTADVPGLILLEDGFSNPILVHVTINQQSGAIALDMELGPE